MNPLLTPFRRPANKEFQNTSNAHRNAHLPIRITISLLLILLVVAAGAFVALPGSSAAPAKQSPPSRLSKAGAVQPDAPSFPAAAPRLRAAAAGFSPLAFFRFSSADSVATFFAADCTTPKASFNLGDTVCAQVSGPVSGSLVLRRVQLVNPAGLAIASLDVTTNPQTVTFTLPTDTTTIFNSMVNPGDSVAVDNRGTWRIILTDTSDGDVVASAAITVHDPAGASADLQISKTVTGDTLAVAGSNIQSVIWVFNAGPDTASNVSFTDTTPSNTTFQSLTPTDGSASSFTCTTPAVDSVGTTTCTKSSMAKDEVAGFIITYKVSASIANGSDLTSTASVTSDTTEAGSANNTSDSTTPASNPTTPTCSLTCPANISATADTVENFDADGDPNTPPTPTSGTHVTLPNATASGSTCGTVTSSTPSGSFFPVGSTPVTYTAADGTTCEFLVTVTSSGSPVTISCPANMTANADSNCAATVTLGTPTTTGDNVIVTSSRSDGKPLTDPFPSGVTNVTWTASNDSGTQSCTQTVTVNDITPPVINVPAQSASADANCQAAIPDLTANPGITDNCACDSSDSAESCMGHPHISVTQDPAPGTLVGLGPHTITLTANDGSSNNGGAGNTTTATVTFTVNDTTLPTFTFVPPSVTANTGAGATACSTTISNATLGTATASDNCSVASVTRSPSGNTFPVGTTTVTWTATDGSGNTATATQTVTVVDNTPPTITAPSAVTANTDSSSCSATGVALGTPVTGDNCSVASVTNNAPSSFPRGTTTVTWTVTDGSGNTATATQVVTVIDHTPPVITVAGANPLTVECHTTFNDPGATAADTCDGSVAVSASNNVNVNVPGTYTVTYSAHDTTGNTATATRTVNVVDTTAPVITTNGQTPSMWPPNHKYITWRVTDFVTAVTDSCNTSLGVSSVVIEKVTSDEPDNGGGDGDTSNDMVIASDCKSVQLRAERNGSGDGRVYTITFKVTDASGNVGRATAKVVVPHDNGHGGSAVDSGVHNTVNGGCP